MKTRVLVAGVAALTLGGADASSAYISANTIDGRARPTPAAARGLGTDLWALGAWWGAIVAPSWERTVATSLDGIRTEAERRAHRRS